MMRLMLMLDPPLDHFVAELLLKYLALGQESVHYWAVAAEGSLIAQQRHYYSSN